MNSVNPAPRVLVFDSGVGGLSILKEIQRRLPGQFIYASDNAAFPYGTKTEEELIDRVDQVLHRLLDYIQIHCGAVDIIVVACNTASTLTLPHIRSHFHQPIVGVVPAIKPAALQSTNKVIGLLATPATVVRPYTHELIKTYAADCEIISVGSSELVYLAEEKLRGKTIAQGAIDTVTAPFREHARATELDTIVLACTHFPLMLEELIRSLPNTIRFIDSGEAIARRVEFLWENAQKIPQPDSVKNDFPNLALFTRATPEVNELKIALNRFSIDRIDIVDC